MSNSHQPPRYHHWTETLLDMGTIYAILWFFGLALSCWMLPLIQSLVPSLWGLALPFFLPVIPSLALALALWLLARRHGYSTVWAALADGLRHTVRRLLGDVAPAVSSSPLTLGTTDDGRPFSLDTPGLDLHFLVDGKTRQGKTTR